MILDLVIKTRWFKHKLYLLGAEIFIKSLAKTYALETSFPWREANLVIYKAFLHEQSGGKGRNWREKLQLNWKELVGRGEEREQKGERGKDLAASGFCYRRGNN